MKFLLLCWLMITPLLAGAQVDLQAPPKQFYTLKIPALELVNGFQQTVTLQLGVPFSPAWGLDMGVGYVFNSLSLARYEGESFQGLKLQPALRYSTKRSARKKSISLSFKYIDVHNKRYVSTLRQGGQYQEWLLRRKRRLTTGVSLLFSSQHFAGKKKRWIVEPYTGFGWRQLRVSADHLPPDAVLLSEGEFLDFDRVPGIYSTPDLVVGFRVGWVLGEKE